MSCFGRVCKKRIIYCYLWIKRGLWSVQFYVHSYSLGQVKLCLQKLSCPAWRSLCFLRWRIIPPPTLTQYFCTKWYKEWLNYVSAYIYWSAKGNGIKFITWFGLNTVCCFKFTNHNKNRFKSDRGAEYGCITIMYWM